MTLAAEYDAIPTATKRIQANEHGAGIVGENGSVCTIVDTKTFDHERAASEPNRDGGKTLWVESVHARISRVQWAERGYGHPNWSADNWSAVY